ncbi:MAG: hypothetical protein ACLFUC_09515 [Bacteroidales bacterium]
MLIKQLSVFLENKSGRITEVLSALGDETINIKALTVADTSEFGILRMLVSEPDKAYRILKNKEFSVNLTDVLMIATPCESGSFAKALKILSDKNISIEYMYAFSIGDKAALVMRTEDTDTAISAIQENNMELLNAKELNNL